MSQYHSIKQSVISVDSTVVSITHRLNSTPPNRVSSAQVSRPEKAASESQILQDIINILRAPRLTRCINCQGLGLTGKQITCDTCMGKGKILS